MRETTKMNAMRSGVVVIGALAFGYLTLQLGFKPFLERAEAQQQALLHQSEPSSSQELSDAEFFFSDDSSQSDQKSLAACLGKESLLRIFYRSLTRVMNTRIGQSRVPLSRHGAAANNGFCLEKTRKRQHLTD